EWNLPVQERGGRRTFVSTNAGYRLEIHPPRDWINELLEASDDLRLAELQLSTDDPREKATALADLLDLPAEEGAVEIGETVVRSQLRPTASGRSSSSRASAASCARAAPTWRRTA